MVEWSQYPGMDQRLLQMVEEGSKQGRSKASVFRDFAAWVATEHGLRITPKACEVRHMRLTTASGKSPHSTTHRSAPLSEDERQRRLQAAKRVIELSKQGMSLSSSAAKVAREQGLTERQLRYAMELLHDGKGHPRERAVPRSTVEKATPGIGTDTDDQLLEAMANLASYGSMVEGFNLHQFAMSLAALARGVADKATLTEQAAQAIQLKSEVDSLQKRLTEAQAAVERYKAEVSELRAKVGVMEERWQGLDDFARDFFGLSAADKMARLPRFLERLKYSIDQFGNVVAVEKELVEA